MFHHSTVEPETYQTLQRIFLIPAIQKHFALAGGTSLSLQLGHRKSIDLDIFSPNPINVNEIEMLLSTDEKLSFEFVNSNKNMLFAFLNKIKCDFIYEPHKVLEPFISYEGVNYFSLLDIAAMKMHAICGRGKRKDFFDLYVLVENFGWQPLLDSFRLKYDESQLYFLWRSIHYFSDADEDVDIKGFPPYKKSWDEVKEFIIEKCI